MHFLCVSLFPVKYIKLAIFSKATNANIPKDSKALCVEYLGMPIIGYTTLHDWYIYIL